MFDFQTALDQLREHYDLDFAGMAMSSDLIAQNNIKWQYASGSINERYKKIHLQRGKGVAGIVMKSGRSWIEENIAQSDLCTHLFDFPIVKFEQLTCFAAIPLWKYNKVAAVLLLGNRHGRSLPYEISDSLEHYLEEGFGPFYGKDVINSETVDNG